MSQADDTDNTTPPRSIAGSAASKTSPALKAPDRIDRRKALAVVAAAPIAVALSSGVVLGKADPGDEKLLGIIRRYKAEVTAMDARHENLSQKDIDVWRVRADAILAKAANLPVLTATSALAILDLVIDEEDIGEHSIFGDHLLALVGAVKNYIASTGGRS